MRMRVLTHTNKGKLLTIADEVTKLIEADKATDVAKVINKADDVADKAKTSSNLQDVIDNKIVISEENKISRDLLNPPSKPGKAPTFKKDGKTVEIHHIGQNPNGPFKEMHHSEHRGKGNYKSNNPNGSESSKINRNEFNKLRNEYWKNEYKSYFNK